MLKSHISPVVSVAFFVVWLAANGHCQYDPYGGPPYYGEPQPYLPPYFPSPEGFPFPQASPLQQQLYPPVNANNANFINPFLLAANQGQTPQTQQQQQQQQQQLLQQLQGSYPNLPSVPFQTVTPNNPFQGANRYPFNPNNNLGNLGNENNNQNQRIDKYPFNPTNNFGNQQQQQQQTFGNTLASQPYPNLPNLPFQTISPTQYPPIDRLYNPNLNVYQKPKIPLPRIRVIEFPSSEYFEYGGGKLVQPKRPNADLYVGGSDGDVPITSRVFIECTGPNQVEWIFNSTSQQKKELSVVTKNIQITIPEERDPTPGSREYTYLRLGLEEQISEKDSGVYICRDRILPQNYISIRVLVASRFYDGITVYKVSGTTVQPPLSSTASPPTHSYGVGSPSYPFTFGFGTPVGEPNRGTGRPSYPFKPKDPNTIYYSRSDSTVTLPCKIEDAQATISLHKHEGGKLSCPYTMDGRVVYDRFKGFIMQTRAFQDLEGRYVCVGDFSGELRLMKYKLVASEDFAIRYVDGEAQNVIAIDEQKKSASDTTSSASSALLAKVDSFPKSVFSGLTIANLTGSGLVDPRSEFDIETAESSASTTNNFNSKYSPKEKNSVKP